MTLAILLTIAFCLLIALAVIESIRGELEYRRQQSEWRKNFASADKVVRCSPSESAPQTMATGAARNSTH